MRRPRPIHTPARRRPRDRRGPAAIERTSKPGFEVLSSAAGAQYRLLLDPEFVENKILYTIHRLTIEEADAILQRVQAQNKTRPIDRKPARKLEPAPQAKARA